MCGDKTDDGSSKKLVRRWSKGKEDKKEENTQTILAWMIVTIGGVWIQEVIDLSEVLQVDDKKMLYRLNEKKEQDSQDQKKAGPKAMLVRGLIKAREAIILTCTLKTHI